MKRVNVIIALVFVSLFTLSACGDENEVNEMIIDEFNPNSANTIGDGYQDDAWD